MPEQNAHQLIKRLRSRGWRNLTGILLLDAAQFGKEADLAVTLGVESIDYAAFLISHLPKGATHVAIDAITEESRLDEIAMTSTGMDCVLIYNFDLMLARLDSDARAQLWLNLREHFPKKTRALLLGVPREAAHLLPNGEELERWRSNRTALASEH